jgi:hypothetical protein
VTNWKCISSIFRGTGRREEGMGNREEGTGKIKGEGEQWNVAFAFASGRLGV